MSNVELCRQNGWKVGDVLEGDEGYGNGLERIRITAIGEDNILARLILRNGKEIRHREAVWVLDCRVWEKVNV